MTTVRRTADGSGFLQETAGIEMASPFSTADGYSSCDNAGQGEFIGVPVVTIVHSGVTRQSTTTAASIKITVV